MCDGGCEICRDGNLEVRRELRNGGLRGERVWWQFGSLKDLGTDMEALVFKAIMADWLGLV